MTRPAPPFPVVEIVLPTLVAVLGLFGSLAMGLVAPPDASRVAVLAFPGLSAPWAAIDRLGLPVVEVLMGGMLVVVDGAKYPRQMGLLRAEPFVLLNASLVPGCSPVGNPPSERPPDGPHA